MLSNVPFNSVINLARDPLIRLVMASDGLSAEDMMHAFSIAMTPAPANDSAGCEEQDEGAADILADAHALPDRASRTHPIRQGHIHIVW